MDEEAVDRTYPPLLDVGRSAVKPILPFGVVQTVPSALLATPVARSAVLSLFDIARDNPGQAGRARHVCSDRCISRHELAVVNLPSGESRAVAAGSCQCAADTCR